MRLILTAILSFSSTLLLAAKTQNYGEDAAFLDAHTPLVELQSGQSVVAIAPAYQARVMTSSAQGRDGESFGWLNYDLIKEGVIPTEEAEGRLEAKIHVFGGEERFWLGPEGGQYGIFFEPGADFDFDHWKTPAPIDTEPFKLTYASGTRAVFEHDFSVTNHSGTRFDLSVEREICLLDRESLRHDYAVEVPEGVDFVAYESINRLTNRGESAWEEEAGLLSVWILGMYKPSAETVMAIPYRDEAMDVPVVNDAYFGKVADDRLTVRDGVIFFKGDGGSRGKIGLPPQRSLGVAGSYSPEANALTLVKYPLPEASVTDYVNSMWETQVEPFAGDAINAYNDGSPAPGVAPLGPFYELETSSPALALESGESYTHRQLTLHMVGDDKVLSAVSRSELGVSVYEIQSAL